ncbi:MAG: glycoside hydrolase family 3 protein [Thermodesulfobacteriota bacterium]
MKYGIDKLSPTQRIGQIIMPRLDFTESNTLDYAKELIERYKVGSFIIMRGECEDTGGAIRELQNISPIPLILGCDAERGLGQILSGATLFPFTMALGAIDDESLVYRQARFIADEMRAQGLNMIFAPVLDVNSNPDNPIIGIRSYGDDPDKVSRLGSSFIRGSQDNGIMACAKHYPGHGSSDIDSHIDLPTLSRSIEEFLNCDLIPFQEAIRVGVSSIMTAHIAAPRIDENLIPATFSDTLINDVLFRRLEFRGLVISDSFHMEALSRYGDEADMAGHAMAAGCDIILDPVEPARLIEELTTRVKDGRISTARLEGAVGKVINAKLRVLDEHQSDLLHSKSSGSTIVDEIARRSVCLLKGRGLDNNRVKVFVFDVTQASDEPSKPFVAKLVQAGIECEVEVIRRFDADVFFQLAPGRRQAIICLTYTSVGAWKDNYRLPEGVKLSLKRIGKADCDKFLISFGSPYVVRGFENFDTIICAFDRLDACQIAAAEVLLGKLKPEGILPVRLNQL